MPKIVVEVMPKRELLDPAGKAVQRSLAAAGNPHITDVRIGKRFEITSEAEVTAELMEEIAAIADDLLSNGVIEDVISIEVVDEVEIDPADTETVTDDGFLPTGAANDAQAVANETANAGEQA
ncbi:phosphoribosylformylglycinamidine synthase subunit PurS [Gulosibacter bifidus]|uniref:Phosphoribosylformylglycinamidine synthase subunit PurS n=1 Tax=Gulosibacter bifidus TaxID=272239 RepID=A0ABW5RLC3_9MICO|nr:phosphoribosylformylglycinamidine synthase subunit PurS [Gulosibacter bifidus]